MWMFPAVLRPEDAEGLVEQGYGVGAMRGGVVHGYAALEEGCFGFEGGGVRGFVGFWVERREGRVRG